jgi:hypothetical protein
MCFNCTMTFNQVLCTDYFSIRCWLCYPPTKAFVAEKHPLLGIGIVWILFHSTTSFFKCEALANSIGFLNRVAPLHNSWFLVWFMQYILEH